MSSQTHELDPNYYPPELLEKFMAYHSYDKVTLLALSLVCKCWLPLARSFLFDKIRITPPPRNEQCDRVLDSTGILPFIRHVAILLTHPLPLRESDEIKEVEYLSSVVKRMEQADITLKSLTITCIYRDFNLYRHFFESLSASSPFSDIAQLNVKFLETRDQDIFPFFCSFPRLRILCVGLHSDERVTVESKSSSDRALTRTLPISLEKLILNFVLPLSFERSNYIENWISSQPKLPISELAVCSSCYLLKLRPFASLCSKHLRRLTLDRYPSGDRTRKLDLSSFRVLESLEVGFWFLLSGCGDILQGLKTIRSSRFRRLVLMEVHDAYLADPGPLTELAELIAAEEFSHFIVEAHIAPGSFCQKGIERIFEKCMEQGRLEIMEMIDRNPESNIWRGWRVAHTQSLSMLEL
ncbi:hypothetical protein L218DRAFT_967217 [Marasmius fiardii PR-910]|nr:hypothetical protein L218DRAFT_967217 [Marasmius fiardii PR-910]